MGEVRILDSLTTYVIAVSGEEAILFDAIAQSPAGVFGVIYVTASTG